MQTPAITNRSYIPGQNYKERFGNNYKKKLEIVKEYSRTVRDTIVSRGDIEILPSHCAIADSRYIGGHQMTVPRVTGIKGARIENLSIELRQRASELKT